MKTTVSRLKNKNGLRGIINIPGDKSVSHRSVMFGSIAEGITEVSNFLTGEDCICTRRAFEALGVKIESPSETSLRIYGRGFSALTTPSTEIYLGNSGTGMRLLTGLFAGLPFSTTLTGDHSLSSRPMRRVIDPLSMMGAMIESNDGRAPLTIIPSKLHGISYHSPVASAQVKSAILLAGLNAEGTTTVTEDHLSRNHTELMLEAFGTNLRYNFSNDIATLTQVHHQPVGFSVAMDGRAQLQGQKFIIPSDISSAAFFLVAAAIVPGSELKLPGVGINSTRTGIIDVLKAMGADIVVDNKRLEGREPVADITVRYSELRATTIEGDIIPRLIDEIPVIAVLAAQARGTTVIRNAEELKVKESNRITSTVNMMQVLGARITATDDGMIIEGNAGEPFSQGGTIDSKGDHRIAMSSAVAALHALADIEILETEFVNTSFPGFFSK